MKLGVRGKLFAASLLLILGVGLASGMWLERSLRSRLESRIESDLLRNARAGRDLVEVLPGLGEREATDRSADRLGRSVDARVTIIAGDGKVLGDSQLDLAQLAEIENHSDRPEVLAAFDAGVGIARRYSTTLRTEMLYVAVPFEHSGSRGVVRVATPLAEVDDAVASLRLLLLVAGIVGLAVAVFMSGLASHLLSRTLRLLVRNVSSVVDGGKRHVSVSSDDELGRLAGSFNVLAGDLDRAVSSLASERDRLQTILEGMSEAVVALDQQLNVSLVNGAAVRLLGLDQPPSGPIGEAIPALESLISQADEDVTLEFALAGSPPRLVLARRAPLRETGGSVIVMHDVTEMRRLERVRRDFIANVSHELRTPVSVIRANAETLLGGALADQKRAREFVGAVHRSAERLSQMISDLLDLSRIEAGEFRLNPRALSLELVVRRAAEALERSLLDRRIPLSLEVGGDLRVWADDKALEHILLNLMENAVKYTQEGGHVVVRAAGDGSSHLLVEVEDDGPGIHHEHRDRIFERFYRLDPGRSREVGGTGLGLSIVKHLVESQGGQVGVRAAEPQGSVFWFRLPSAPPDRPAGRGEEPVAAGRAPLG